MTGRGGNHDTPSKNVGPYEKTRRLFTSSGRNQDTLLKMSAYS
jgi:hypothetical protein